jgi:hypothetical protein
VSNRGRKRLLTIERAAWATYAIGVGVAVEDVAQATGVCPKTIQRILDSGLLDDARCQRLAALVDAAQRQKSRHN